MVYEVEVIETYTKTFSVTADDPVKAETLIRQAYENKTIDMRGAHSESTFECGKCYFRGIPSEKGKRA